MTFKQFMAYDPLLRSDLLMFLHALLVHDRNKHNHSFQLVMPPYPTEGLGEE